jgi:osmotically-inducible protein OsmY
MRIFSILSILSVFVLSGCGVFGVATGVGAVAGMTAAQNGGVTRAFNDAKIQTKINDLWFKYDLSAFSKLDLTVNQGRVLVTGVVQNPEHRVEAIRLAWQPAGVTQVINEVKIAESTGIIGYGRDAWISTRLRAALTFDKHVQSVNYNIDTVQGTVYLMGFAQSRDELNRVIGIARTIPDVRQVVSYVKISGVDSPYEAPDSSGTAQTTLEATLPESTEPPPSAGEPIDLQHGAAYPMQ